jgi:16S rRNA (guanine527-N7)-methyltransferase
MGFPESQIDLLERYCTSLWQLNRQLNLTRHTSYEKFVARDVVDSVHLAGELAPGQKVLDVGTGGGVPGIVLAIIRPDLCVELCESVGKKAAAASRIVHELQLPVPVHHARAEILLQDNRYDALVARAVGPLWKILHWLAPHWASIGKLLLVKGPRWIEERGAARSRGLLRGLHFRRVVTYTLSGTDSQGVILAIWPKAQRSLSH